MHKQKHDSLFTIIKQKISYLFSTRIKENKKQDYADHRFKSNNDESGETNSQTICRNSIKKEQILSDRSDIRVFEVGLSNKSFGNTEQSERDKIQQENQRLISIAKNNNLFIENKDWDSFGERKRKASGESIVYIDKTNSKIIKIKDPFAKLGIKGSNPQYAIYEHIIHNILFSNARYTFLGISATNLNEVRIILSQNYSNTYDRPSQKQIEDYLANTLSLKKDSYYYSNDFYSITDVDESSDNVLLDENNQLCFIDPIIKLNKPPQEVIDFLISK